MFVLTEDAVLVCKHELGKVDNKPTQELVTIDGKKVLVETDPEGRPINGCPLTVLIGVPACKHTLKVEVGYSEFIRIDDRRFCLDTVTGFTDGQPPGTIMYKVRSPGQEFVSELA